MSDFKKNSLGNMNKLNNTNNKPLLNESSQKTEDERFKIIEDKFASNSDDSEISDLERKKNEKIEENETESVKEYDLIDDAISENLDEEKDLEDHTLDNFKEKVRRSGVVYISYIPEGMTVSVLRKALSKYSANRIYLVPDKTNNNGNKKRQNYKEGWVEFTDKLMAKLAEYELNGKIFGGKKRNNKFREELWSIKYLNKFKWHHLMEKMQFNKKLREHRMKAELSQIKRENNFILEKFEQSKRINNLNKKKVMMILFFINYFQLIFHF